MDILNIDAVMASGGAPDVQPGDIYSQHNWYSFFENPLSYQHSGLVVGEPQDQGDGRWSVAITDCMPELGCTERNLLYDEHARKYAIVRLRLKNTVPYRKEIISTAVKLSRALAASPNIGFAHCVGGTHVAPQFIRLLTKNCLGDVGWDELKKYLHIFMPVLKGKATITESVGFFCSRFVLLMYQIAALWTLYQHNVSNKDILKFMQQHFDYHSKYCRPSHIAYLNVFYPNTWKRKTVKGWIRQRDIESLDYE
jgi:hypothetical protein